MNSHNTPRKSNSTRVTNLPLYSNSKFLSQATHSPKQNFLDTSVNKSNSKVLFISFTIFPFNISISDFPYGLKFRDARQYIRA